MNIKNILHIAHIYHWYDLIEISFFALVIYSISLWLNQDTRTPLTQYFYVYLTLFIGAYYGNFSVLYTTLLITSPVVIGAFIIFHQHILQANFVTLKNTRSLVQDQKDWYAELIKILLTLFNQHRSSYWILERTDLLTDYMQTSFKLYTPLQQEIITMIIESSIYNEHAFLWVNSTGCLVAFNAYMCQMSDTVYWQQEPYQQEAWKQKALMFTTKTDSIILRAQTGTNRIDLVIKGTLLTALTASETYEILRKIYQETALLQKEGSHVQRQQIFNKQSYTS